MKFPQWLNAIDLLRKLPKTSGERVILSKDAPALRLVRCSILDRGLRAVEGASPYGWCVAPLLVADRGPPRTSVPTVGALFRRWSRIADAL